MELLTTVRAMLHQSFALSVAGLFCLLALLAAIELWKRSLTK